MQLSVDQKIEKAIQPLLERISALEADNEKFKQELAAIHASHQPKPVHKPGVKPVTEPVERPQTVKGGRKKSVEQHGTNVENKTDKKPIVKKQDGKGEGQELKQGGSKTGINSQKGIVSPNTNKDHTPSIPNKDIKTKPTTATGGRTSGPNLANKSTVVDKKNPVKPESAEQEKKEGEDNQEEKKQHKSQDKVENKQPSAHGPKTPVINKGKTTEKPDVKKPVVTKPAIDKKPPTKPVTTAKKVEQKKQVPAEVVASPKQQTSPEHKQQSPEVVQQEGKGVVAEPVAEQKVQQHQQQPAQQALLTEDPAPVVSEQQQIEPPKEEQVTPAQQEETL